MYVTMLSLKRRFNYIYLVLITASAASDAHVDLEDSQSMSSDTILNIPYLYIGMKSLKVRLCYL